MKRLIYVLVSAFATVAIAMACQVAAQTPQNLLDRDWKSELVLMGNDLPVLLHYQPTDGASYSGHIRKAMDPSTVRP